MNRLRQAIRFAQINWVLLRYGLDELILGAPWLRPFRFLRYFRPWALIQSRKDPKAVRVRKALETLGPIFVKLGQMLSTRADLLPPDYANELSKLQDQVPPFSGKVAIQMLEEIYGRPVHKVFLEFDETALAAASIAQVHAARLHNGQEVVVKIIRPAIRRVIESDLALMYLFSAIAERYLHDARRLRATEVIAEYDKSIHDELDLVKEGSNAAQLKRNFEGSPLLYIPEINWDLTHSGVLVSERIRGIPVDDLKTLRQAGVNLKNLAEHGVEIFFKQVFEHNFFHADMHPGNLFVDATDPDFPAYLAVDFGICGTLNPEDQRYLAENFLAFFNRDYDKVARLHVESGWVPKDTPINEFAAGVRSVCEPIFNRPLKEISFAQLLLRLFQTARRFDMQIQPQLTLLQKTLLHIEGLGRMVYPELDLWHTAKPYLENWMDNRIGPKGTWHALKRDLPEFGPMLAQGPRLGYNVLNKILAGEMEFQLSKETQKTLLAALEKGRRDRKRNHMGAALIIAGILLVGFGWQPVWGAWAMAAFGFLIIFFS